MRHLDGELAPDLVRPLEAHLETCELCQRTSSQLLKSLTDLQRETAAEGSVSLQKGLAGLIAGMEKLRPDLYRPERRGEAMKQRVGEQIRRFLGAEAAARLLEPVSANGDNLLSTIEPVLADFLGDRAASELVNRIIDNALLRS